MVATLPYSRTVELHLDSEPLSAAARRIADAAVDVTAERGYDGLTVRSVARAAGLTGGAVQHHFATRSDLLAAALVRTAERIAARVDEPDGATPPRDRLLRFGEELLPLDETRRRECVVWVVLSAAGATDPRLAALHRRAVGFLLDVIADRLAGGRVSDPRRHAAALAALLDGLTLQCLTGAVAADEARRVLAAAIDLLLLLEPGSGPTVRG